MTRKFKRNALASFLAKNSMDSTDLCFSKEPQEEFGYFGAAFFNAARVLCRSLARRKGYKKADILPLLYLYRHSIELQAKAVILAGNRLMSLTGEGWSDDEVFKSFKRSNHRLTLLLPYIEKVLKNVGWEWFMPGTSVESFSDLKRLFSDLEIIDRNSFTFRYPTDKHGHRASGADEAFDLNAIVAILDSLSYTLEITVGGLEGEYSRALYLYDADNS